MCEKNYASVALMSSCNSNVRVNYSVNILNMDRILSLFDGVRIYKLKSRHAG